MTDKVVDQEMIKVLEKYGVLWRSYHSLAAAVDDALRYFMYGDPSADAQAAHEFALDRRQQEEDRAYSRR